MPDVLLLQHVAAEPPGLIGEALAERGLPARTVQPFAGEAVPEALGEAAEDPLFEGVPPRFTAFHWHGDAFARPAGCERLAWSAQTGCQAFRYGAPAAAAYGLLFHLEVTPQIVQGMTVAFAEELRAEEIDPQALREDAATHLPALQQIGRRVFGRWAERVAQRAGRTT